MTTSNDPNSEPSARCQLDATCEDTATPEQPTRKTDRRISLDQTETLLDEALEETFPASDPVSVTPRKQSSK